MTSSPSLNAQLHPATIHLRFSAPNEGYATLVITDSNGKRIRNLLANESVNKGENIVDWDGTDDLSRDVAAANHGIYNLPAKLVDPGTYTVRGLWHRSIDLRYQMSLYSPGDPPWPTKDGTGGWTTNHTPPSSALFIPKEKSPTKQSVLYIGSYVSEGGSAVAFVDLDGKKVGGRGWVGGNWTGAQFLARDEGPVSTPGVYAYVGSSWKSDADKGKGEIRLTALTSSGDKPVLKVTYTFIPPFTLFKDKAKDWDTAAAMGGLAVHNGLLVFSQPPLNQLVLIDAKQGTFLNTVTVPNPRGLAFDGHGRLLSLSGKSLLRFDIGRDGSTLSAPTVILANLEDPMGITLDGQQTIYVSDRGASHQVKAFSEAGQLLRTYGKAGAPSAGPYDTRHMNNPKGLAVDSNGRLWVTEEDFQPKRLSVWNPDGTLWNAFYGPSQYGGGGTLDPHESNRFYYDGMEFNLDWQRGGSSLSRILFRSDPAKFPLPSDTAAPDTAIYLHGHRYFTNAFNSNPTNGSSIAMLFLDNGKSAVPVAAMGCANDWDLLKTGRFHSLWPEGLDPRGERSKNQATFVWNDLNADGQVQPEEITISALVSGGVTVGTDGSFLISRVSTRSDPDTSLALIYSPTKFTPQGVPVYSLAGQPLASHTQSPASTGGDQVLEGTDGWTFLTTAPKPYSNYGLGGVKNGVALWSYPSLWPGLHASHSSPVPDRPGMLIGTTRLLGEPVIPRNSEAGPLFFINGNQGNIYVFTQDGLFVTQLFQDVRQGKLWQMPKAEPGMLVNDLTLHDEDFFTTVSQVPDGSIYVMAGAIPALVRVDGLDTIRRIPPVQFTVTAEELQACEASMAERERGRQQSQKPAALTVKLLSKEPSLTSGLADWNTAESAPIDKRGVKAYFDAHSVPYNVTASVAVTPNKLYALWKTDDPGLLRNSGAIPDAIFKTGSALDLMLGTNEAAPPERHTAAAGDLRLLVTQVQGRTKAILYRPLVPGSPAGSRVPFSSPWRTISFDSVQDVSASVQLTDDGKGDYQIAVPLAVLALHPHSGMKIKADLGILRGDGDQTIERVYWSNKATAIVSDVPSEAELTPDLWGTWTFQANSTN